MQVFFNKISEFEKLSKEEKEAWYNEYVPMLQAEQKKGNLELLSKSNPELNNEVSLASQKVFFDAITYQKNDVVKLMLDLGIECISPKKEDNDYGTSINQAIIYRNVDALRLILEKRSNDLVEITKQEHGKKIGEEILNFENYNNIIGIFQNHFLFSFRGPGSMDELLNLLKEYEVKIPAEVFHDPEGNFLEEFANNFISSAVQDSVTMEKLERRIQNQCAILDFLKWSNVDFDKKMQRRGNDDTLLDVVAKSEISHYSASIFLKFIELGADPKKLNPVNLRNMINNLLSHENDKIQVMLPEHYKTEVRKIWDTLKGRDTLPPEYTNIDIDDVINTKIQLPEAKSEAQKLREQSFKKDFSQGNNLNLSPGFKNLFYSGMTFLGVLGVGASAAAWSENKLSKSIKPLMIDKFNLNIANAKIVFGASLCLAALGAALLYSHNNRTQSG